MSYDEHKEARLELAEAREEIKQLKRDVAGQTRSAQNGWRTADDRWTEVKALAEQVADTARERDALRAQVEAVRALADEWERQGIPCDCGHTLDTHNGLGCYARLSYEPLVSCDCKLTDDRTHDELAVKVLRSALSSSEPVTAGPECTCYPLGDLMPGCPIHAPAGEVTPPAAPWATIWQSWCDDCEETIDSPDRAEVDSFNLKHQHAPARPTTEGGQP